MDSITSSDSNELCETVSTLSRLAPRAELLHVLRLPDFDRADRIGEFWGYPESRTFAEFLIECEEDQTSGWCWSGCCGRPKRGR